MNGSDPTRPSQRERLFKVIGLIIGIPTLALTLGAFVLGVFFKYPLMDGRLARMILGSLILSYGLWHDSKQWVAA